MRKKLIYFHGFGSSAASGTVATLRKALPTFEVVAPDIPVDPMEALPLLRELCEKEMPDVVVGTSMGGMYAQQMFGYRRICVNPAFEMSRTSKVLKAGTFDFFKKRLNGETQFTITQEIINHHAQMEEHQFDGITEFDRKNVWGMFGDQDEQVDCKQMFVEHYGSGNVIDFHGGHRLSDDVIYGVLLPLICRITR